jgi:ABC-type phosphate transport system auxiliary subunit
MYHYAAAAAETSTWPGTIFLLGSMGLATFLIIAVMATLHEFRKTRVLADQEEAMRQLVRRYEQLAENSLDAQQRIAADLSELRSRTSSIEQILRTVE